MSCFMAEDSTMQIEHGGGILREPKWEKYYDKKSSLMYSSS